MWKFLLCHGISFIIIMASSGVANFASGYESITQGVFISFPKCASNFAFSGQKIDFNFRVVRSEIECAHLCKGEKNCSAYNLVRVADNRLQAHLCELLENNPTGCDLLEVRTLSRFKYYEDYVRSTAAKHTEDSLLKDTALLESDTESFGSLEITPGGVDMVSTTIVQDTSMSTVAQGTSTSTVVQNKSTSNAVQRISQDIDLSTSPFSGVCNQQWTLLYENNGNNTEWGSIADLKEALLDCAWIRIDVTDIPRNRTYIITNGYQFDVTLDQVCLHVPFFMQTETWDKLATTSQWAFSKICTSGIAEIYSTFKSSTTTTTMSSSWYYKPNICADSSVACADQHYVLTNLHDGTISQGSKDTFLEHVVRGHSVSTIHYDTDRREDKNERQGTTLDNMSDDYNVYMSQTLVLSKSLQAIGAQHLWSFSTKSSKSEPFVDMTLSSTDGRDGFVGWSLNKHKTVQSFKTKKAKHSWLVDSCWKLLYRNALNDDGDSANSSFGSHDGLVSAVSGGHRVRVTIEENGQTLYVEADHVTLTTHGVVVAQVISSVATKDLIFDRDGLWNWYFVHSSGVQCGHRVLISEHAEISSACQNVEVSWFVDKRKYDIKLETDFRGKVVKGSKQELRLAIKESSVIRIEAALPSDGGMKRFLTLEMIELGRELEESAVCMRVLQTTFDKDGNMRLSNSTHGMVIYVTSEGSVGTGSWIVGSLLTNTIREESAQLTWFVSS